MDAPPPLSKSEQALAQIKADEASEASSRLAAIFGHQGSSPSRGNSGDSLGSAGLSKSPELGIRNAVGIGAMLKPGSTVGGGLKWSEEAETKLKELAHGDEVGRAVMLVSFSCSPNCHPAGWSSSNKTYLPPNECSISTRKRKH